MPKKTAQLIDGKLLAERILLELKGKIAQLDRPPGLAAILIGNDPASKLYIKNKEKACLKTGINFYQYLCNKDCYPDITEKEILEMIDWLNQDPQIDGIIIQLPLPKKFNTEKIINRLDPKKDVDGFHPENRKKFLTKDHFITPPLIEAIKLALESTGENLKDKKIVVLTKGSILSDSLIKALKKDGLNVTGVTPENKELTRQTKTADILIVIIGRKNFIKKSMIKPDAIVIDAGTNLIGKNKWVGDVNPKVKEVASFLTPVPGGIGPLTVAMLLQNTYQLCQKSK